MNYSSLERDSAGPSAQEVGALLKKYSFPPGLPEKQLQDMIASVLSTEAGKDEWCWCDSFSKEHILAPSSIADFFFEGSGLLIEVKVGGNLPSLLRQLSRYSTFEEVKEILVVSSKIKLMRLPHTINNTPLCGHYIGGFI